MNDTESWVDPFVGPFDAHSESKAKRKSNHDKLRHFSPGFRASFQRKFQNVFEIFVFYVINSFVDKSEKNCER